MYTTYKMEANSGRTFVAYYEKPGLIAHTDAQAGQGMLSSPKQYLDLIDMVYGLCMPLPNSECAYSFHVLNLILS